MDVTNCYASGCYLALRRDCGGNDERKDSSSRLRLCSICRLVMANHAVGEELPPTRPQKLPPTCRQLPTKWVSKCCFYTLQSREAKKPLKPLKTLIAFGFLPSKWYSTKYGLRPRTGAVGTRFQEKRMPNSRTRLCGIGMPITRPKRDAPITCGRKRGFCRTNWVAGCV